MIIFEVKTIEEAIKNLKFFASHKPYKYSGKWLLRF